MAKEQPTPAEFLKELFRPAEGRGWIELRAIPNDRSKRTPREWCQAYSEVEAFGQKYGGRSSGYDVYFGAAPRKFPGGGKKDDVLGVTALWADVDCLSAGHDIMRTAEAIMALPSSVHPSAMIHSGGGLHCYWFYDRMVLPNVNVEYDNAMARNLVGGDAVQDVTRVMRLPGTFNNKRTLKRECRIIFCRPHLRYEPAKLTVALNKCQSVVDDMQIADKTTVRKRELYQAKLQPLDRYSMVFRDVAKTDRKLAAFWRDNVREHAPRGYVGIHDAQVITTARLFLRRKNLKWVVERTLEMMQECRDIAQKANEWDWEAEAEKLAKMTATWAEKIGELDRLRKAG